MLSVPLVPVVDAAYAVPPDLTLRSPPTSADQIDEAAAPSAAPRDAGREDRGEGKRAWPVWKVRPQEEAQAERDETECAPACRAVQRASDDCEIEHDGKDARARSSNPATELREWWCAPSSRLDLQQLPSSDSRSTTHGSRVTPLHQRCSPREARLGFAIFAESFEVVSRPARASVPCHRQESASPSASACADPSNTSGFEELSAA